jgi:ABC-type multidrug transport system fused ATPase/permease subunit
VTTVVIAHRIASIRDADVICVLDAGRVAETGTWDALIAQGGLFARLERAQRAEVGV